MTVSEDDLARYFTARAQGRQREIADAYPDLETAAAAFIAEHHADPRLPVLLARMLREMAVAAFVRGTMHAAGTPYAEIRQPQDSVMLHAALETIRSMDDLYPAFALFDGRNRDDEEDGAR